MARPRCHPATYRSQPETFATDCSAASSSFLNLSPAAGPSPPLNQKSSMHPSASRAVRMAAGSTPRPVVALRVRAGGVRGGALRVAAAVPAAPGNASRRPVTGAVRGRFPGGVEIMPHLTPAGEHHRLGRLLRHLSSIFRRPRQVRRAIGFVISLEQGLSDGDPS